MLPRPIQDLLALGMWLSLVCATISSVAFGSIIWNDGQVHDVDWVINDVVFVNNSPAGEPTTVNVLGGGSISIWASEDSRINFYGGEHQSLLRVEDNTMLTIWDGVIQSRSYARDYSQVTIAGGLFRDYFWFRESATGEISGGQFGEISAQDDSIVVISGGHIGGRLLAYQRSTITIRGTGFNYPYGELPGSGVLVGTLENGDPIDVPFWGDSYYPAVIILEIPEPMTLLLLGLGSILVQRRRNPLSPTI